MLYFSQKRLIFFPCELSQDPNIINEKIELIWQMNDDHHHIQIFDRRKQTFGFCFTLLCLDYFIFEYVLLAMYHPTNKP